MFDSTGRPRIITVVLDVQGRDSVDTYAIVGRFSPDTEAVFGVLDDSTSNLTDKSSLRTKRGAVLPPGARLMSNDEVEKLLLFGQHLWSKRCPVTPTP